MPQYVKWMVKVANSIRNQPGKEASPKPTQENSGVNATKISELLPLARKTADDQHLGAFGFLSHALKHAIRTAETDAEKSITPNKFTRIAVIAGIFGSFAGVAAAVTAAALSPWFNWSEYPLSYILSHSMGPLLASGVIGSGVSLSVYSACLYQSLKPRLANKIGAGMLALSGGALAVLGVTEGIAHLIAASTFFLAAPLGLTALGVSMITNKMKPEGFATIGLSVAATAVIVVGRLLNDTIIAPVELAEAGLLGIWLLASSISLSIVSETKRKKMEDASHKKQDN
ncbi:MAG: DUF998 domain-containing protein [Candidatus Micrarchaeaceae archaeon]